MSGSPAERRGLWSSRADFYRMPDREPAMIVTTGNTADLLTGIGIAVRAYTQVEASQSRLLSVLLGIDIKPASAIFFSVQNVRSRNELFNTLLTQRFDDRFTKFWESCSSHLQRLADVTPRISCLRASGFLGARSSYRISRERAVQARSSQGASR